ncbi:MAG: hypothetical protein MJB14_08230, partial [Spirochaetes bacterium]|nr:hypothetical protein [Spirochaetota bacterium]
TAQIIDEEVKKIILTQQQRAKDIIMNNRDKLVKVADTLYEKETLDAEEIYKLLDLEPTKISERIYDKNTNTTEPAQLMDSENKETEVTGT